MNLLIFLLIILTIAFVLAQVIFKRETRKPKGASRFRASDFKESNSHELTAEATETESLQLSELEIELPTDAKPHLVETVESDLDWWFGPEYTNKTSNEILRMMFPQTLVSKKQDWKALKDSPKNKNDLDLMLACCKSEIETSESQLFFPTPACFKRVAIILHKQKDYYRELGIIELYWQRCDRVYEGVKKRDGLRAQLMAQHSALKAGFKKRYDKAKLLLEMQK